MSIIEKAKDPRDAWYGSYLSLDELYCMFEQLNLSKNDIITFVLDYEARDVPGEYGGESGLFWESRYSLQQVHHGQQKVYDGAYDRGIGVNMRRS